MFYNYLLPASHYLTTMSLATLSSKILRSARTHVRAESMRPMTVLSKQSAEEYKKQVWCVVGDLCLS